MTVIAANHPLCHGSLPFRDLASARGEGLRLGFWILAALIALWGCGAGFVTIAMSIPARDIDGPVPWTNRAFWTAVGIGLLMAGAVAPGVSIVRIARLART
jgi:hypothetical protein